MRPLAPYFSLFEVGAKRPHVLSDGTDGADGVDPDPEGYIMLCVAENKLNTACLRDKLVECSAGLQESGLGYCSMRGRRDFRAVFASMLEYTGVVRRSRMDPEHLCMTAGVGGLINNLCMLLMEAGQGVMLHTPTYAALYNDISAFADGRVVDVPTHMIYDDAGVVVGQHADLMSPAAFRLSPGALEHAHTAARAQGVVPRIVLLLNPNNPLGTIYSAEEVRGVLRFAAKQDLHVIADEIYANSVFGETGAGPAFVSIIDELVAWSEEPGSDAPPASWVADHVHVLWGASKDWSASGLRVGALYTRCRHLLTALDNVNYFTAVSNLTQDTLARMFEDRTWCVSFLSSSRCLLRAAYEAVGDACRRHGIPYLPAVSGMFVWLDLRAFLRPLDGPEDVHVWADEEALTLRMFEEARILFTPGAACHAPVPGFYRCCFAFVPLASLRIAFQRLAKLR